MTLHTAPLRRRTLHTVTAIAVAIICVSALPTQSSHASPDAANVSDNISGKHNMHQVTVEDYVATMNLIGEYQWLVDSGDSEGWANMWTEDGTYSGGTAETFVGREELKKIPAWVKDGWQGKMRHLTGSHHVTYGADTDEVIVKHYTVVTTWNSEPPKLFAFSLSKVVFVRRDGEWKIKSKTAEPLAPPRSLGDTE